MLWKGFTFYGLSYVTINSVVTSINSPTWPQLLPTNFDGLMIQRVIPLDEVTSVRKAKTAGLFPNAIEIVAGSKKVCV